VPSFPFHHPCYQYSSQVFGIYQCRSQIEHHVTGYSVTDFAIQRSGFILRGQITNLITIADAFNTYFSSVAGNLLNNLPGTLNTVNTNPPEYLKNNYSKPNDTIHLKNTTTHEIDTIIHSLKCKDSHGYNEVSTRIIKTSAPHILSSLILILNKILSTEEFLKRLKFSEVKPLHKKGIKTELSNYHPISLLPSFSKIIETVITKGFIITLRKIMY
jgi:hypothetical protein